MRVYFLLSFFVERRLGLVVVVVVGLVVVGLVVVGLVVVGRHG
jgi:hypothetical protein